MAKNQETLFNIVLVSPEIPGNTGSIGRTCLALNSRLILIHPLGFDIDEKAVRRAGLDYWKELSPTEYQSIDEFFEKENPERFFLFTKKTSKSLFSENLKMGDFLIFGPESKGLSEEIILKFKENTLKLPVLNESIRSLNLASCVTAVLYQGYNNIISNS
ncbi:MAG: tRNA (cytidine(34)-2'-O)-methyltransferase [Bacteriovoracaceae bacterium]